MKFATCMFVATCQWLFLCLSLSEEAFQTAMSLGKLKIQVENAWQLCCVDITIMRSKVRHNYESCWLDCPFFLVVNLEVDH